MIREFKLTARDAGRADDAPPANGNAQRSPAPQRIEYLSEPGPIDLRGPPTIAALLAQKQAERKKRIQWSDQDNDPVAVPAKPPVSGSVLSRTRVAIMLGALAGLVAISGALSFAILPGDGEQVAAAVPQTPTPETTQTVGSIPARETIVAPPPGANLVPQAIASADAVAAPSAALAPVLPPEATPAQGEAEIPPPDDPRWAAAPDPKTEPAEQRIFEGPPSAAGATTDAPNPDETVTAAVEPTPTPAPLAIAPAIRETIIAPIAPAVAKPAREEARAAVPLPRAGRQARVATAVNMRAGRSNGSRVIGVVQAGSAVSVVGCDYWCEIVHNGRRGYVYKAFLQGQTAASPAAPRQASAPDPERRAPARNGGAAPREVNPAVTDEQRRAP